MHSVQFLSRRIGALAFEVASLVLVLGFFAASAARASTLTLDFSSTGGTINDAQGEGTGFTQRLPGTGGSLAANDAQLNIQTVPGTLTMNSNIGTDFRSQSNLGATEATGIPLSSLGLTNANEDFTITGRWINTPTGFGNANGDEWGVYVGTASDSVLRGSAGYYVGNRLAIGQVQTPSGPETANVSLSAPPPGGTMEAIITRTGGVFQVLIGDGTNPLVDVTPAIQPTFLNGLSTLNAGLYIQRAGGGAGFVVTADSFTATVVPEPGSLAVLALGAVGLIGRRRRM